MYNDNLFFNIIDKQAISNFAKYQFNFTNYMLEFQKIAHIFLIKTGFLK